MSDSVQPPRTSGTPQTGPGRGFGRKPSYALYGTPGVIIATILGSLAAAVVMLYLNYVALGRDRLAKTVSIWGIGLFLVVTLLASLVPTTAITVLLFMAIQAGVAYFLMERLQGAAIRYHVAQGGAMHSELRAAGVGFLTGICLFFLLVVAASVFIAITGAVPTPPPAP